MTVNMSRILAIIFLLVASGLAAEISPKYQDALEGAQFSDGVKTHDRLKNLPQENCAEVDHQNVVFMLYTRTKPNGEVIMNDFNNISQSSLNVKKNLKVLIHGFLQDGTWSYDMIKNYLGFNNVDVLVVDWSAYSLNCSVQSVSQIVVPGVAKALGDILGTILMAGENEERYHLIGFSHGAHIAGLAGRQLSPHTPARVTGLDPLYLKEISFPGMKIRNGDGKFMDVIVTSLPDLTFFEEIGDVTFYPNGGLKSMQSRCGTVQDPFEKMVCAHALSYKLFLESIEEGAFPAVKCESLNKFLDNKCSINDINFMGEYVNKAVLGKFFLQINGQSPYDQGYTNKVLMK